MEATDSAVGVEVAAQCQHLWQGIVVQVGQQRSDQRRVFQLEGRETCRDFHRSGNVDGVELQQELSDVQFTVGLEHVAVGREAGLRVHEEVLDVVQLRSLPQPMGDELLSRLISVRAVGYDAINVARHWLFSWLVLFLLSSVDVEEQNPKI